VPPSSEIAIGILAMLTVGWVLLYGGRALAALTVARLEDQHPPPPPSWPRLSVVIPACNEEDTLEPALATLRAQDYPALEIVLVDDRSTDRTPEIVRRLAEADARVLALRVDAVPAGWLGKVHALARGLERATGTLVLFADADTAYAPGALRAAVALMEARRLDHLTLLPRLEGASPWLRALMAAFTDGYIERRRWSRVVELPARGPIFGFGAFNLVRRATLAATEGLAFARMDIADDLALGLLMRQAGRAGFAVAPRLLFVPFYPTFAAAISGWEKNTFGILARFSWLRTFALMPILLAAAVAPVALAWIVPSPWTLGLLGAVGACVVANALAGAARLERRLLDGLLEPVVFPAMLYALMRSAALCALRGGIVWRGTLYATPELRAGQRAWFP